MSRANLVTEFEPLVAKLICRMIDLCIVMIDLCIALNFIIVPFYGCFITFLYFILPAYLFSNIFQIHLFLKKCSNCQASSLYIFHFPIARLFFPSLYDEPVIDELELAPYLNAASCMKKARNLIDLGLFSNLM
jgi:hypothetical protein